MEVGYHVHSEDFAAHIRLVQISIDEYLKPLSACVFNRDTLDMYSASFEPFMVIVARHFNMVSLISNSGVAARFLDALNNQKSVSKDEQDVHPASVARKFFIFKRRLFKELADSLSCVDVHFILIVCCDLSLKPERIHKRSRSRSNG